MGRLKIGRQLEITVSNLETCTFPAALVTWTCSLIKWNETLQYFYSSTALYFCISHLYQMNATSPTATSNPFNSDDNLIDNLHPQKKGYLIAILNLSTQCSQIGIPKDAFHLIGISSEKATSTTLCLITTGVLLPVSKYCHCVHMWERRGAEAISSPEYVGKPEQNSWVPTTTLTWCPSLAGYPKAGFSCYTSFNENIMQVLSL